MTLDRLIHLDQQVLLWFNGSDSLYLDHLVMLLTSGLTWIPLYVILLYVVIKNNETMLQIFLVIAFAALCVIIAGGVNDGFIKPTVARWRPTSDPSFKFMVTVVDGYRGGDYGFFSSHASNTMALAVFFSLLMRSRLLTVALVCWSLLNGWTRLYLGVHYPGDILCGTLWGGSVGALCYLAYYQIYYRSTSKINYVSSRYTKTGYARGDMDIILATLLAIIAVCMVMAL